MDYLMNFDVHVDVAHNSSLFPPWENGLFIDPLGSQTLLPSCCCLKWSPFWTMKSLRCLSLFSFGKNRFCWFDTPSNDLLFLIRLRPFPLPRSIFAVSASFLLPSLTHHSHHCFSGYSVIIYYTTVFEIALELLL